MCLTACVEDLGTPDGIAFDWINNRVYYSDYLNQTISSMAVDGSNRTVIARVPRPRAIVLDPCRGYVWRFVYFVVGETTNLTLTKTDRYFLF